MNDVQNLMKSNYSNFIGGGFEIIMMPNRYIEKGNAVLMYYPNDIK